MSNDLGLRLLDETRHEIDRADAKASILLAGSGIAAGALIGGAVSGNIDPTGARAWVQVPGAAAALLVSLGVGLLGAAVFPRLGTAIPGRARYFMDIASYAAVADLREALDREAADAEGRHLQQLLHLSRIVRSKYRLTRSGEVLTGIGLAMAGGAGLLHLVLRS